MKTLRFEKTLYDGAQVDAALQVYARFGDFAQKETDDAWFVEVSSGSPEKERRLAGELANYALGLTIRSRRANTEQSP